MSKKCKCGNAISKTALLCVPCEFIRRKGELPRSEYARQWNMLKKYNIDLDGFSVLWQAFSGKCGICGVGMKLPAKRKGQALDVVAIDHDHVTGNIRGLLCNACNKGLGLFNDDITKLINAIKWLENGK
jgi:hypothetical protein